jgi:hypothetical protein
MRATYDCLGCGHPFTIEITEQEAQSGLDRERTDTCPKCVQPVGVGQVHCRTCQHAFVVAFPHWHVHCDLTGGICPNCGADFQSPCIC